MALPIRPSADAAPLLELDGVDASYAAFRALFGVSFSVVEGSALALLGSNGSGKTSVARVI
ncbi:MAG: ATP-binding cassette domain-containing protein, partial [Acidimicrobiia bacterium]|nr:ATP-binding cassette domain-containing protein [Acidimicrobiia bacterium]